MVRVSAPVEQQELSAAQQGRRALEVEQAPERNSGAVRPSFRNSRARKQPEETGNGDGHCEARSRRAVRGDEVDEQVAQLAGELWGAGRGVSQVPCSVELDSVPG